jgi:protein-disulfide isomerase
MKPFLQQPFNRMLDHYIGQFDAPLEVIEYGDFQCTHCGNAYASLKTLRDNLGVKVKFVFRHFPLATLHPLALDAAVACEAAGLQNKFWEMHDLIFENQPYLVRSSFAKFEEAIGIATSGFIHPEVYKGLVRKVARDFDAGIKAGVDSTPTFFINGKRYNGFADFDAIYSACILTLNQKCLTSMH